MQQYNLQQRSINTKYGMYPKFIYPLPTFQNYKLEIEFRKKMFRSGLCLENRDKIIITSFYTRISVTVYKLNFKIIKSVAYISHGSLTGQLNLRIWLEDGSWDC